jgi:hypothetical protein
MVLLSRESLRLARDARPQKKPGMAGLAKQEEVLVISCQRSVDADL